ncbi:MAG: leucine-rich repeat domain-containing protein [Lachnospiraceae bacterium]|nr:leucine-rich repeat domain-containing protein [Lachnospiraceae bacterium]MDE7029229.1 leucine-rich repeat domain-containing protein [Lachnospiraceae bacterium]
MIIKCKKGLALLLALVMAFLVMPVPTARAEGAEWVNYGDGWHYLQGTDIKVKIANDTITIEGTGALPDADYWKLYERPWHTSSATHLQIASTITSIGAYSFYKCSNIKHVSIATSTFIEDKNAFEGIAYCPIFRIVNKDVQTRMIGTIPYTSMDSIQAFAQSNTMGACYILDDSRRAGAFQNSTNPTICNVYWANDSKAPWNSVADNGNGNQATNILRLSSKTPNSSLKVSAQRLYPGRACYEAYAAFIGDYTFATTFNISVEKNNQPVLQTDTEMEYILTIPAEYRSVLRNFRLLAIGAGTVYIYDDLDTAAETITFRTDKPNTAYALVYK